MGQLHGNQNECKAISMHHEKEPQNNGLFMQQNESDA